jgi:hypothetical protein
LKGRRACGRVHNAWNTDKTTWQPPSGAKGEGPGKPPKKAAVPDSAEFVANFVPPDYLIDG